MLQVVVHEKGARAQRFDFEGDQFSVGREEDNDLVLDRVNVSKHHLRFRRAQGCVEILDLQSTNGTYVNGRRIEQPRVVRRSDRIYVGDFILMLEGDDEAIATRELAEVMVNDADGAPRRRMIAVPTLSRDVGEPVATSESADVITSARRVGPAGVESSYLDKIVNRVLQTVLANVGQLDPVRPGKVSEQDRAEAERLVDALLGESAANGELEAITPETLRGRILRELLDLGPLSELMADDDVREIHVVGASPIRIVREAQGHEAEAELTQRRYSGDRAVTLAIRRLARAGGFLVESAHILEGRVDRGFYLYGLLPPNPAQVPVLSLRRNRTDASTLEALVHEGVLGSNMRDLLTTAIRLRRRMLICASGGTNLDRFMRALIGEIPDALRVVCISDTGRLGATRSGWVQVRRVSDPADALSLSDALGTLMRGGVDLLVSQRCRHEDAAAVMDALAGATRGAIVSLWGIDSAHALWRLAGLSTVASGAIEALTVSLARSVDVLVRLSTGVNGESMQVVEIVEPRVKENNEILHVAVFKARRDKDGITEFVSTGTTPTFLRELGEGALGLPLHIFKSHS